MNRLLLVPGILSCVGFIFLANTGSVETYGNPAKGFRSVSSAEPAARVLKSAEQIEEDLLARWNRYNDSKQSFSRVYRPRRYQTPGVLVNGELPTPAGSFVGIFTLQDRVLPQLRTKDDTVEGSSSEHSKIEFPFVVDRETGEAIVFAAGQWTAFDQWAVNGE
ncbi:MAG: hypothetical protein ABL888_13210 [Pirellulaceae bacterium]